MELEAAQYVVLLDSNVAVSTSHALESSSVISVKTADLGLRELNQ